MKQRYDGLRAIKVDFGSYNDIVTDSLPAGCIRVVANINANEFQACENPGATTSYLYFHDGTGGFPIPEG